MINIVYDVDDVLNNLNDYVIGKLGLVYASNYNIRSCPEYTREQQDKILAMYNDPETFRNLKLVPGARDICKVEETGKARVWINSSCLNVEIEDIKRRCLLENIPGLNKDRLVFQVGYGMSKKQLDFTDIIVEDCITNLTKYNAQVEKILIDKKHNQAKTYCISDWDYGIKRVDTLLTANKLVMEYVNKH